jgi:hypothetical protein
MCLIRLVALLFCFFSEELAPHLHEDERQRARSPVPVAAVSHGHARPYAHAQPASGERNKKESVSMFVISRTDLITCH